MVLTEKEAASKWCPKVQLIETVEGDIITNRYQQGDYMHTRCTGSNCMWWRWVDINKTTGLCGAID
jgi:hypothetical protein